MATDHDVDADALREELHLIQDAMGIGERYPSRMTDWLVFGVLVAVAATISQYVHLRGLPTYWHPIVWVLTMGGGTLVAFWRVESRAEDSLARPSIPFQFAVPLLAYFPLIVLVAPVVDGLGYRQGSVLVLGLVLVLLGIAYLGVGNALRAYQIRRRDRFTFSLGGLLMMALGAAMPHSAFLVDWGYAAFGASYLVYALASYAYLARS